MTREMLEPYLPLSASNDFAVQELAAEILVYDLNNNKAYCLNETSAMVYQLCNGRNSIPEISRQLTGKLKSTVTEDFVWLAINQLKKENLLENEKQAPVNFEGVSRREIVRKAGIASLIALPLVTSLVVPTAAQATSAIFVACVPAGTQATATAPNPDGRGLFACLTLASQKCCNVPPFAFQSSGPNRCDGFSCSCTFDCK